MCGIAGYIGEKIISDQNIDSALNSMLSRGPDSKSHKKFESGKINIYLLHTRLSIIDLDPRSNQPFSFDNLHLVFNGEIYNYIEVREKLKSKGYSFDTNSDTEVLIKSFHCWGNKMYDFLEGMWAFVIFDSNKNEVILCRDRFAEKPLYFSKSKEGLYFASEIKTIFCLTGTKNSVNLDQINRYLINGYKSLYKYNETFYQGIEEVDFSTYLVIDSKLNKKEHKYWSLKDEINSDISFKDIVNQTKELLIKSVKLRLRSDVPLAFCLSGGIDSASLASIAAKEFNYNVSTFSIIDNDERYNEYDNIMATVNDINCEHTLINLSPDNKMNDRLRDLISYHDGPVATISYLVHSILSEKISEKQFKVSVSGTAADELFTGYYDHFNLQLHSLKDSKHYSNKYDDWVRHIKPFVRNPHLKNPKLYNDNIKFRDHIYLNNIEFSKFLKNEFFESFIENNYSDNLLHNRMMNELFHEGSRVVLHEDDLNSMMYSVENRSPYLDRNLAEFAYSIPIHHLINNGYGKFILRESMKGILNDKVRLDRQKKGFNASISSIYNFKDKSTKESFLDDSPVFNYIKKPMIENFLSKDSFSNSESKFLFNFINVKYFLDGNK